jgi:hypothetical protein
MSKLAAVLSSLLLAAPLAAAPSAALADPSEWGVRLGIEAPVATHVNDGASYSIADTIQTAVDLLVVKGPRDFVGFGFEGRVGFAGTNGYGRAGTSIGPTMTLNIPVVPIFLRGALPIHLEPGSIGVRMRLTAGLKVNLQIVGLYLEGILDLPLAGLDNATLFGVQQFSLGAGGEVRF